MRTEGKNVTRIRAQARWLERRRVLVEEQRVFADRMRTGIVDNDRRLKEFLAVHSSEPRSDAERLELERIFDSLYGCDVIDSDVLEGMMLLVVQRLHLPRRLSDMVYSAYASGSWHPLNLS